MKGSLEMLPVISLPLPSNSSDQNNRLLALGALVSEVLVNFNYK